MAIGLAADLVETVVVVHRLQKADLVETVVVVHPLQRANLAETVVVVHPLQKADLAEIAAVWEVDQVESVADMDQISMNSKDTISKLLSNSFALSYVEEE
ncbi:hypothetical protein HOO54_11965 [Bacillus sp. WMMC1349]|uniref:hypothetical protein n=1 Tax=Bacillus sp. WMMC1349 TaxID=2736254 RepID=UPI0015580054|nr:hypothetical protein [Bacillus sp. WMMC1349]NPC92924.1 hypothetical protein [Bacillus sp. WMMC1349]